MRSQQRRRNLCKKGHRKVSEPRNKKYGICNDRPGRDALNPAPENILVAQSVSSKRWLRRTFDERDVETMCQQLGLETVLAETLSARGINSANAAAHLNPSLRTSMPDPLIMADMEKAAARLAIAIQSDETVGIFGDYDVDGTTSSALLSRYFQSLNVSHEVYLPDRITEGYGPNLQAFRYLQCKGASLCLTVDCGAMAHEILEQVALDGLDVVVIDHHQMTLPAPPAVAVVNPNRPDDISGLNNLSAVGVTFMVLVALNRRLREDGFFENQPEPNLIRWLDLVALGLVCDVMPLTGLTRVLVAQGLKVMGDFDVSETDVSHPGLFSLAQRAGAKGKASAYHLGFVIGPRINAAGRIGHANLAYHLMKEKSYYKTECLAEKLEALNKERQHIESGVLDAAIAQIEGERQNENFQFVLAASTGWHPGVIGIVAGRLKEKYNCPAIVICLDDNVGKGSGRSVEGIDLGGLIAEASRNGLLVSGGGHAMAAGLTIERENLEDFRQFISDRLEADTAATPDPQQVKIDGIIGLPAISRELADKLDQAGPFGNGYPEPRMMIKDVRIRFADVKAGKHVACTLSDNMGNTARAIAFRCVGEQLGDTLLSNTTVSLHLVGKVKPDEWRGGSAAQLIIEDAALA